MPRELVLLVTDIEGSTRLTEQLGDAAASSLWAEHDRTVRRLLHDWHGREIDKSDGFLLLFDEVDEAVGFALDMHRALDRLQPPLATRAGIHCGAMVARPNSNADIAQGAKRLELDGVAKAVAARIMTLSRGGQTLLSASARAALSEGRWQLTSHGHWRLKGVAEPLELFEVGDGRAPLHPPPDSAKSYRVVRVEQGWAPVAELRHGLPAERNGFVGRVEALTALAARLDGGSRLITLLGIGGIGKTRLALRYARLWLGNYPGGAWFCGLSSARNLDGIAHAVAQGLDVPLGKVDPVQQLGAAIAGRGTCLVILDNFEQVARHAEATVGQWLERAPHAALLVTSREVLGIPGEEGFVLSPLTNEEAVQLFLRRAESADHQFSPAPQERALLPTLVNVLDRLPLAVELAAARVRVMRPQAMLERMGERFKLLASTGRRQDRQATLRATLDWSWELLLPAEQSALTQLSAFEGGFTLEAAEAVVDLSDLPASFWVTDAVQGLVEKSLVRAVTPARFDMLGSVHDYAAERLDGSARAASATALAQGALARHARYFSIENPNRPADSPDELSNIITACRRAANQADFETHTGALVRTWECLKRVGPFRAILNLTQLMDARAQTPGASRLRHAYVTGSALTLLGQTTQAREQFDLALGDPTVDADSRWRCRLEWASGEQLSLSGEVERALLQLQSALALAVQLDDAKLTVEALNTLGVLALRRGDAAEATRCYGRALSVSADTGARGALLGNLGEAAQVSGRLADARRHYEDALVLVEEAGHRRWEGNTRCNLGLVYLELGLPEAATAEFEQALQIARDMGYTRLEATVLCNLGIQALEASRPAAAREHLRVSVDLAATLGDPRMEGQFGTYLGLALSRDGDLEEALTCLARAESQIRKAGDVMSLGLLCSAQSELSVRGGEVRRAQAYFREASQCAREAEVEPASELAQALRRLLDKHSELAPP